MAVFKKTLPAKLLHLIGYPHGRAVIGVRVDQDLAKDTITMCKTSLKPSDGSANKFSATPFTAWIGPSSITTTQFTCDAMLEAFGLHTPMLEILAASLRAPGLPNDDAQHGRARAGQTKGHNQPVGTRQ